MRVSCLHALLLLRLAWPVRGLESWEGKSQSTIGPTRSCGTPELTKQQRSDVEKVLSLVKIRGRKESTTGGYQANSRKVIPICFHVIGDRISRTSLQRDLDQLNEAFSASSCCNSTLYWCNGECSRPDPNIKFVMARSILGRVIGTTRAPTNSLACVQRRRQGPSMTPGGVGEIVIKSQMRVGDGRFLNIYYADLPEGLLGYSSIPSQLLVSPILDGVVVHRKARVGGNFTDFNMGKTLGAFERSAFLCSE